VLVEMEIKAKRELSGILRHKIVNTVLKIVKHYPYCNAAHEACL
jgi:hypothetical protein